MPTRPDTALVNATPELRAAEALLRKNAAQHGITYEIADFGGLRTAADTTLILKYRDDDYAAYLRGLPAGVTPLSKDAYRPIAAFGSSYHNYGAAFDVLITGTPKGMTAAQALQILKIAAPAVGLRSSVPNDPPHFELPITLSEAKARWERLAGVVSAPESSVPAGAATGGILLAVAALAGLILFAWHRGAR